MYILILEGFNRNKINIRLLADFADRESSITVILVTLTKGFTLMGGISSTVCPVLELLVPKDEKNNMLT